MLVAAKGNSKLLYSGGAMSKFSYVSSVIVEVGMVSRAKVSLFAAVAGRTTGAINLGYMVRQ